MEKVMIIKNKNGLHTRVAAMVVRQAQIIEKKYKCQLFIKRLNSRSGVPCNSVLPLVSLKIKYGESVVVFCDRPTGEEAVLMLTDFLEQTPQFELPETEAVDSLLQESTLASEKIFESINNGLIAMDSQGIINIFNRAAEEITGIKASDIIGKKVMTGYLTLIFRIYFSQKTKN